MCSLRWLSSSWSMYCRTSNTNHRWVAHIKEAARQTAREKQIFHKTWQAENLDFLLCHTRQTSACHVAPIPACPRTVALRLALCPSLSLVSPFTFVLTCAHLPILHYWREQEEFDRNFLGTWWEQKDFWWVIVGNKRNLIGIFLELDENKRILMGYWWEQEKFDGNCVGPRPLQKDKK
jgi:hypothetical protein